VGLKQEIDDCYFASIAGMDIPWMLEQQASRRPDKPCLIWRPFEGETQSFTYAELFDRSRKLAAGLKARGVNTGDFVLLHMDNSPEFVFAWYGCAILGAVAVSTNTRSVARDMSYFTEVTEAVCALTQPKYAEMIYKACPDLKFVAVTDNDAGEFRPEFSQSIRTPYLRFDALIGGEPVDLQPADPTRNLSVQFTSGTTSRPKAVLWTHGNGIWAGRTSAQHYRLRDDDVAIVFLPLFHTNAQGYSMLATHWSGGTIVLQPKFSGSRFWDVCLEHQVTWASMISFTVRALVSKPVPQHNMRFWSIGVRVPDIEKHFNLDTLGLWGMTETLTHGICADMDHLGPPMTIGRAAPGYEVQIRGPDGGLCALGETGRLFLRGVRGVSLCKEYYRNPEATMAAFDDDGWLDTGDLVRTDTDGWMYFCDRDKDMLRVGAENVSASEVEAVIMESGLAAECAVVGQKHYMLDEVPVVFLIPAPAGEKMQPAELKQTIISHCEANLPDFKVVRDVHVVDRLPRSTLEKVAKNILREQLAEITAS